MSARTTQREHASRTRAAARSRSARAQRPTLSTEWARTERTLDMFEDLRALAARERGSRAAAEVEELAWRHLREAEPIRISHAQRLLGVSNQTVREWMNSGVLDPYGGSPQRVGLESVIRAKLIADELRQQGRERDLMSAVLSRLEALALANDKDFRASVKQMRRGERLPRPY